MWCAGRRCVGSPAFLFVLTPHPVFHPQYYVSPDGNTRLNSRAAVLRLLEDSRPSDLRRSRRRREAAQTVNGEAGVAPGPAAKRRKAAVTPLTSAAAPADVGGAGGAGSAQARLAAPDSGNNSVETAAQPTAALASSGAAGAPQLRDRRPKQQKGSAACTPPAAAFPLLRRRRRAAAPGGSASASPRHPKPAASPVSFELFQFDAAQASPAAAGGQSKGGLSKTPSRLAAAAPGAEQSEKAEAAAAMAAVLEPQPRRVSRFFGVVGEGAVADAPRLPTVASRAAGDASTDGFASSLAAKAGAAANGPAGQNRRGVRRLQPQPLPRGEPEGWVPPASPWGLIEEQLYADPWKILVACICLNKTTAQQASGEALRTYCLTSRACGGAARHQPLTRLPFCATVARRRFFPAQVRSVMWELFTLIPTPEAALCVTEEAILVVIRPLGQFYRAGCATRQHGPLFDAPASPSSRTSMSQRLHRTLGASPRIILISARSACCAC